MIIIWQKSKVISPYMGIDSHIPVFNDNCLDLIGQEPIAKASGCGIFGLNKIRTRFIPRITIV